VDKRISQMKTGNSNDFIIEKIHQSKWGTKIEAILHRKFSSNRINGEWFELSEMDVEQFEKDCVNLDNYFQETIKNSTFKNPKTFLI
jgi:hypothetical protein